MGGGQHFNKPVPPCRPLHMKNRNKTPECCRTLITTCSLVLLLAVVFDCHDSLLAPSGNPGPQGEAQGMLDKGALHAAHAFTLICDLPYISHSWA